MCYYTTLGCQRWSTVYDLTVTTIPMLNHSDKVMTQSPDSCQKQVIVNGSDSPPFSWSVHLHTPRHGFKNIGWRDFPLSTTVNANARKCTLWEKGGELGCIQTGPLSTSALRPALLKPNGCFTQQHYVQVPNLWLSSLHSENSLIHLDQIRMKRFSGTFVYLLASSCESAHEPKAVPQNCVLRHMQICAPRHGSPSAVCASC